jgi:hypothetical protein
MKKSFILLALILASSGVRAQFFAPQYRENQSRDFCQAMEKGTEFLLAAARNESPGKSGWPWQAQADEIAPNITGLTALALLESWRSSGDSKTLALVRRVADGLVEKSASWSESNLPYKPDLELLARLGKQLNHDKYSRAARSGFEAIRRVSPKGAAEIARIWEGRKAGAPRLLGFDAALAIRAAVELGERAYAFELADAVLERTADWLPEGKMDRFGFVSLAAMTEALQALDAAHYARVIDRYRNILVKLQQPNGSWVMNETQPSAYAALALADGTPAQREAFRKAVEWLKSTMLKKGALATYNDYMPEPFVGDVISEVHAEALAALARACRQR